MALTLYILADCNVEAEAHCTAVLDENISKMFGNVKGSVVLLRQHIQTPTKSSTETHYMAKSMWHLNKLLNPKLLPKAVPSGMNV